MKKSGVHDKTREISQWTPIIQLVYWPLGGQKQGKIILVENIQNNSLFFKKYISSQEIHLETFFFFNFYIMGTPFYYCTHDSVKNKIDFLVYTGNTAQQLTWTIELALLIAYL